jgi:hypothetical protein
VSDRALKVYKKEQRPVMATSMDAAQIVLGTAVGGASEGCAA